MSDPAAQRRRFIETVRETAAGRPSITCPDCGRTSHHPTDVEQGYCGNCHWWTSDPNPVVRADNPGYSFARRAMLMAGDLPTTIEAGSGADDLAPDPAYAQFQDHPLHDVPRAALEAARRCLIEAARYGDVASDVAGPLADSVIIAALPELCRWLAPEQEL